MVEVSNTYHLSFTGPCVRTMPLPKYNEFFFISTLHIAIDFPVKNEHRSAFRSGTSVYYSVRTNIYFGPNRISNIIRLSQIVRIE